MAAVKKALDPNIPGLLPPEPMGNQFETEDALRSDLPGVVFGPRHLSRRADPRLRRLGPHAT